MTIQQIYLGGPRFATWNPADKGSDITLSSDNRTATWGPTSGTFSMRGTIGVATGKWYWEVLIANDATFGPRIGIATTAMATTALIGNDTGSYGIFDSFKVNNGISTAYGTTYAAGDVIGVALDLDGGTLVFYKNNVSQGTAFLIAPGSGWVFYPAASDNNTGSDNGLSVTANFNPANFSFSAPSGFLPLFD